MCCSGEGQAHEDHHHVMRARGIGQQRRNRARAQRGLERKIRALRDGGFEQLAAVLPGRARWLPRA
jgi:hypothetical protein